MPTDAPAKKLQLTDTPNVAQVIRIVKQLQYEDRWHRRLRRWFSRGDAEATVAVIGQAASARKRIDAAGKVVVEGPRS